MLLGRLRLVILGVAAVMQPVVCQSTCERGIKVEGTITDPTGAVVVGARVGATDGETSVTDEAGRYVLGCVPAGDSPVSIEAEGFAAKSVKVPRHAGRRVNLNVQLSIATVETAVQVKAENGGLDSDQGANTVALDTQQIQQLADDPDDFVRQLQVLAAEAGGDPSTAHITVDGFQNASALPPKGSIASIRVNPDLYSAEYEWPPYGGGLIEITTKPGTSTLHGAGFVTESAGALNATDPFSVVPTPAGKRRYGFELGGSLVPRKADFSLALEKRNIDEFDVVNAKVLGSDGTITPFRQTVAAPQRLWIGSARSGWQLSATDTATLSFAANVNDLGNQGAGGLVLPEAGCDNLSSEYDLRLANTATFGANLLNETRVGFTRKRTSETPNATDPSLVVGGYFTRGGSTAQNLNEGERDLEADDDVVLTRGKQTIKAGFQSLVFFMHNYDPDTFNGAFVFGGGSAPVLDSSGLATGEITTIDAMEQYRRALNGLAGGAPTTYQLDEGNPLVSFTQWQQAFFAQDTVQLPRRFTVAAGLRVQEQTAPLSLANFEPRIGLGWATDKKSTWVFHLRAGIFNDPASQMEVADVFRLNGRRQQQTIVYSPDYLNPMTPPANSIAVNTIKEFAHGLAQKSILTVYFNAEHDFPHQWHARVNLLWGADWNRLRIRNINAPMVATSTGTAPDPLTALRAPRPVAADENIVQYENAGHLNGNLVSMSLDQHSSKRFGVHATYRHLIFKSDGGDALGSPQSSYSNQGESSRADWMRSNAGSFIGNINLPLKVEWAMQFDAASGGAYNITTGTDANGDGIFNDRPSFASAPGPGVYVTPLGLMTTNAVNGNVPRNAGTLPGLVHLDTNLSRAFELSRKNADHPRTLTLNARSANALNHTNTRGVSSILAPTLGQPTTAEPARRIEFGARFSF